MHLVIFCPEGFCPEKLLISNCSVNVIEIVKVYLFIAWCRMSSTDLCLDVFVICTQKIGAIRLRVGLAVFACLLLTASEAASASSVARMTGNDSKKVIN